MVKRFCFPLIFLLLPLGMTGCSSSGHTSIFSAQVPQDFEPELSEEQIVMCSVKITAGDTVLEGGEAVFTAETKVWDVINNPAFGDSGRLIFPADKSISGGLTLGDVGNILTWYSYVSPDRTVEIANYLKEHADSGEQIFYDIYTEEEKAADPAKEDTGLFFFRGAPGEKFAITNVGGGFVYVAAMHDSFPNALELLKKGYNAFALIYRPGVQTAWLGSYGTAAFGEADYPKPGAVIMQYTGLSEVTGAEPPTYACVGTSDGIAYYGIMEERIRRIQAQGTSAEIEVFEGLPHGFGLGEGTVAEGWLDNAAQCEQVVYDAIKTGYGLLDTAASYENDVICCEV